MDERRESAEDVEFGYFGLLDRHRYASLSTFKKDGTAVATAVWFAEDEDRIYVTTLDDAGKVKRIRNNSRVTLEPCDVRGRSLPGGAVEGRARMISDEGQERDANRRLARKYGLQYRAFGVVQSVVARQKEKVFIEISAPAEAAGKSSAE